MTEANNDFQPIIEWLQQWWPALLCLFIAYFGLKVIFKPRGPSQKQLDSIGLAVHEIRTTLACSEEQARKLLSMYNGNSAKAINEVKTGKAVLPGAGFEEVARFGGEFKSFSKEAHGFTVTCHNGNETMLPLDTQALLMLAVVDSEQRADEKGHGRADRGKTYGQLFWKVDGEWVRFLLCSSRSDFSILGDQKVTSAIRNFRLFVGELLKTAPNIQTDASVQHFSEDLRAPLFGKLADFDAVAAEWIRQA